MMNIARTKYDASSMDKESVKPYPVKQYFNLKEKLFSFIIRGLQHVILVQLWFSVLFRDEQVRRNDVLV